MPEASSANIHQGTEDNVPKRTRTGCLTCRRRKKKCDEARPSCTACHRNDLNCRWESHASLSTTRRRRRCSRLSEKIVPEQAYKMMNVFSTLKPDISSRLLSHFLHASPKWLSTRTGSLRTDYMRWLHPAMSESPLVLKCIYAIAAADLLKYHRRDLELQHVADEYYGQTISELRNAIENEVILSSTPDTSLTDYNPLVVVLLCVHETQNFTLSERILPHLNAAVCLLQNRLSYECIDTSLRGFLFETFCYFFSLAAFSLGSKLSLYQACPIFNSPSVIWHIQCGHIMGTSQNLFLTIYRVSILTQDLASQNSELVSEAKSELQLIQQSLDYFQSNSNFDLSMDSGYTHDVITSDLYRLACQIHVKRLLTAATPDENETIQQLVENFVTRLRQLPSDSPAHSILSWPLVVAGYSATTKAHQDMICSRLGQIYEVWQSDIFSKSATFLRAHWKKDKISKCGRLDTRAAEHFNNSYASIWHDLPVVLA